jgi:RNA polymerase sigma-70 factor (ECF subfamily)
MSPDNPASNTSVGGTDDRNRDMGLLEKVRQRDQQALAALYDCYSRPLYSVVVRILSDGTEAEDVIQEVFILVWSRTAEFNAERGSLFSWMICIARNAAIDRLRKRQRRLRLLGNSSPLDFVPDEALPGSSVRAGVQSAESAHRVKNAFSQLGGDEQHALELAYFSGLTQPEIAARLQAPIGTIKARIRRALLKLRELLGTQE